MGRQTVLYSEVDADCSNPLPPATLVSQADLIVRATVIGNSPVSNPGRHLVRFNVLDTLKGTAPQQLLDLEGVLSNDDQFNSRAVPYEMTRNADFDCYAKSYKPGAGYLLLLKAGDTGITPYWAPLSATNEQLHPDDDPWLAWVKKSLQL
jgi:hypothetical protein